EPPPGSTRIFSKPSDSARTPAGPNPVPVAVLPLEYHLVATAPGHAVRPGNTVEGPAEAAEQLEVRLGIPGREEWRKGLPGVCLRRATAPDGRWNGPDS